MKNLKILFLLLLLFYVQKNQLSLAQERVSVDFPRDFYKNLKIGDKDRSYLLHAPNSSLESIFSQKHKKMPLVLVFHGGAGNAKLIKKISQMNEIADKENFIVVYPEGSGRFKHLLLTWNAFDCCGFSVAKNIDDVRFVKKLVEYLIQNYNVDESRVYAVGFSNGGMFTYRLACELSDVFSAVAIISGSMSGKEAKPKYPVSLLIIHGTEDKHVPYEGGVGKTAKWGYPVNSKSLEYALSFWKEVNECHNEPVILKDDSPEVFIEQYFGKNNSEIRLVKLVGAMHAWPGGKRVRLFTDKPFEKFKASQLAWQFFLNHRRNNESSQ